ncbi:uncharacterized protein JNUCC1_02189 [Lentibacillus sp. JNUCC-1]|uniref:tRNA 2-selenouridine(34) synthase MnmH n=1 Tax=Lentibacillus sp. JNUCC-1 TaxID=2654513 RepID=UPI0012E6F7DE|nr:tRNA 2-selenouridine(34) synthase MnmH [Lentibacillus sp. JNUCC-1]MUV38351.1 uncharacterized protein [Lentibacillus sp. JNUCC-1]
MIHDISIEKILEEHKKHPLALIDVRSPKEYQEATIPGSINIPIFNNEERAEVGTLYKQAGSEVAKQRGLEIFSAKLPAFIEQFKALDSDMAVFCWRGGMRSKTAATVLDLMGIQVSRLKGGYRSYRKWIVNHLDQAPIHPDLFVLNGYTGSGKTTILHKLEALGEPVIDLEGMAGHRGSIFGHIGLKPANQKTFDALLFEKLTAYQQKSHIFIEGESKRIGKVVLPDAFFHQKETGKQLFIELPISERVNNILEDYHPWDAPEAFMEAFSLIKKHIHTPVAKEVETHLIHERYPEAIELLLKYYYDPRYEHSISHYTDDQKIIITARNADDAVEKIMDMVKKHQV